MEIKKINEIYSEYILDNLNSFDDFWTKDIFKSELNNENSKYFVLIVDENVVGFAGLWFNFDEAHIMNIAIKKDCRKNGYGTCLLEFLINYVSDKKECITLEVNEKNIAAFNLYKKLNFEIVGRRKKYYDATNDALIMTKFFEKRNG